MKTQFKKKYIIIYFEQFIDTIVLLNYTVTRYYPILDKYYKI